jgi:hypothetical protein
VLDLRLDQKIDGASGCLHSCMHCARLRVIPWKLACTACCTARLPPSVDEFRSQDFGLKLNWKHLDRCILFCLQNGTLIRPASTRFVIGLQSHARSGNRCAGRSLERLDLWRLDLVMRIPVTTY